MSGPTLADLAIAFRAGADAVRKPSFACGPLETDEEVASASILYAQRWRIDRSDPFFRVWQVDRDGTRGRVLGEYGDRPAGFSTKRWRWRRVNLHGDPQNWHEGKFADSDGALLALLTTFGQKMHGILVLPDYAVEYVPV